MYAIDSKARWIHTWNRAANYEAPAADKILRLPK